MFKIGLNKIHWNTNKVRKAHNLQIQLQVDQILDFSYFQGYGDVKCTCRFPTCSYYNPNTSNL